MTQELSAQEAISYLERRLNQHQIAIAAVVGALAKTEIGPHVTEMISGTLAVAIDAEKQAGRACDDLLSFQAILSDVETHTPKPSLRLVDPETD